MMWLAAVVAGLFGYLLGSIPVGVWVCNLYGVDIRQVGSGRTGATNAWRAAGLKAAIPTLLGDALKGAIAIWIVTAVFTWIFPDPSPTEPQVMLAWSAARNLAQALAGGLAVIGHNWSFLLGFKGGAGGITLAATTMALLPPVGGIVWIIGILLFWWSRMASIATFSVAASTFGIFLMYTADDWQTYWPFLVYGLIGLVAVVAALGTNREKLRQGEERVVTLW
jgi:acyl phosphate:glycerol-3-phosphate acyltransferase